MLLSKTLLLLEQLVGLIIHSKDLAHNEEMAEGI